MKDERLLKRDFNNYVKKGTIKKTATEREINGHLKKAKRNLNFSRKIIDDLSDFYEWSIIAYYYAVYQAALALCALKGYKTKKHLATMCILIKFFYPARFDKEELETVAATIMLDEDIKSFVKLKNYREDATYSISSDYEKALAENLGEKAIDFVNKAERIIDERGMKIN